MILRPPSRNCLPCKLCGSETYLAGVTDFNRSCQTQAGSATDYCGVAIYYRRCRNCEFLYTDAFDDWTPEAFRAFIYNEDYEQYDPAYRARRPLEMARKFISRCEGISRDTPILDYGGGIGRFAAVLQSNGFSAVSTYDPFSAAFSRMPERQSLIVTCYEVVEHIPDGLTLVRAIADRLHDDGFVHVVTGLLPEGTNDADAFAWWYVAPRNGHVSIYSAKAARVAWASVGFTIEGAENGFVAYRRRPEWCASFFSK